jgi:hypothetical protein
MTGDAQLKKNRLQRLNPRAHIGYLVGYNSTNIFRIWIPYRGEVISSRDVIFDEDEFFDGTKVDLDEGMVATLDEFVHQIRLPTQEKMSCWLNSTLSGRRRRVKISKYGHTNGEKWYET